MLQTNAGSPASLSLAGINNANVSWNFTQRLLANLKAGDATTLQLIAQINKLRGQEQQRERQFQLQSAAQSQAMLETYEKLEIQCIEIILRDLIELATGRVMDDGFGAAPIAMQFTPPPTPSDSLALRRRSWAKKVIDDGFSPAATPNGDAGLTRQQQIQQQKQQAKAAAIQTAQALKNALNALDSL